MKDECAGKIMTEFVGLRSKMYAYKTFDETVVKKLKGIKKVPLNVKLHSKIINVAYLIAKTFSLP